MSSGFNVLSKAWAGTGHVEDYCEDLFDAVDLRFDAIVESSIGLGVQSRDEYHMPMGPEEISLLAPNTAAAAPRSRVLADEGNVCDDSPRCFGIDSFEAGVRVYPNESVEQAVAAPGYEDEGGLFSLGAESYAVGHRSLAVAASVDSLVLDSCSALFDSSIPLASSAPQHAILEEKESAHHEAACAASSIPTVQRGEGPVLEEKAEEEEALHFQQAKKRVSWTKEDLNLIKEGLESGKTIRQIRDMYFRSRTLVAVKFQAGKLRKKLSLPLRQVVWTKKDVQVLKRELKKGLLPLVIQEAHFNDRTLDAVKEKARDIRKKYNIPAPIHRWSEDELRLLESELRSQSKTDFQLYHSHFSRIMTLEELNKQARIIRKKLCLTEKTYDWSKEELDFIRQKEKAGMKPSEIQTRYFSGIASATAISSRLRYLRKKRGISEKKYHRWTDEELTLLRQGLECEMSLSAIHEEHFSDIKFGIVREMAKKLGKATPSRLGKRASAGSLMDSKKARLEE